MPQDRDRIEASYFSPDILDFVVLLHRHNVRYVIVGGEAVIHYGHTRLTGDVDFFYDLAPDNAGALFEALLTFWSNAIPGVQTVGELQEQGVIIQFGRPPNRIDLLNQIDGVAFPDAWKTRTTVTVDTARGAVSIHS